MEAITAVLQTRYSRADLDTSKSYIKVQKVGGKTIEEEVGQFVRSYRMGLEMV